MERFAFKIDKVLKANLYKICRLCGIDNPDKVPIVGSNHDTDPNVVDADAEPELSQKIADLIGFTVLKDDKMPQFVCTLCVDKINDFYEFREMCFSTDQQTRKLLGIKAPPKKVSQIKLEVKAEPTPVEKPTEKRSKKRKLEELDNKKDIKEETDSNTLPVSKKKQRLNEELAKNNSNSLPANKKKKIHAFDESGKKKQRLTEVQIKSNLTMVPLQPQPQQPPLTKKQMKQMRLATLQEKTQPKPVVEEEIKPEIKDEPAAVTEPPAPVALKQLCAICNQRFQTKSKLERHKTNEHNPNIAKFFCSTCNEEVVKSPDIKSHQLWHKLSKTPYKCGLCDESLLTVNLFTRHLSNHTQKLLTPILVYDRECSMCHETFITNFLYNIHPCALRTKKCGGCNRKMKSDIEYQLHAPHCDKAYLVPSKHVGGGTEAVRIKNENDVEAAVENFSRNIGVGDGDGGRVQNFARNVPCIPLAMMPVVSLTRLAIPPNQRINLASTSGLAAKIVAAAAPGPKSKKSGGRRGLSKKDLKRVDDLLKSTMDTLVSIKHEPEINVVDAEPHPTTPQPDAQPPHLPSQTHAHDNDARHDDADDDGVGMHFGDDDFQNRDDDSNDSHTDANMQRLHATGNAVLIKQEPSDDVAQHGEQHRTPTTTDINAVRIKTEIPENINETNARASPSKVPVLKLKITKEHGTLNSSLVNESKDKTDKKKKKKKRKDAEKAAAAAADAVNNIQANTEESSEQMAQCEPSMPLPGIVHIKQERQDDEYYDGGAASAIPPTTLPNTAQPAATIMTTIPIMQFQISSVSSGVEFEHSGAVNNNENEIAPAVTEEQHIAAETEQEDVKPNRAELDRLLAAQNSMAEPSHEEQQLVNDTNAAAKQKRQPQKTARKSVATKSTSQRRVNSVKSKPPNEQQLPQIVAVSSGIELPAAADNEHDELLLPQVRIKTEPRDDDYYYKEQAEMANEMETAAKNDVDSAQAQQPAVDENCHDDEEQAYINSLDFSNIRIKQEKDIDVSESQLTAPHFPTVSAFNGMENDEDGSGSAAIEHDEDADDDGEDDEDDSDDDDEEANEMPAIEEKREYREFEWPPLLSEAANEAAETAAAASNLAPQNSFGLTIANVCSQAAEVSTVVNTKAAETADGSETRNVAAEIALKAVSETVQDSKKATELVSDDASIAVISTIEAPAAAVLNTTAMETEQSVTACNANIDESLAIAPPAAATDAVATNTAANEILNDIMAEVVTSVATAEVLDDILAKVTSLETNDATPNNASVAASTTVEAIAAILQPQINAAAENMPMDRAESIAADENTNDTSSTETIEDTDTDLVPESAFNDSTAANIDEAQQNLLNHEMCETFATTTAAAAATATMTSTEKITPTTRTMPAQLESYLEDISSNSCSMFSSINNENSTSAADANLTSTLPTAPTTTATPINHEETENLYNENIDAALFDQRQRLEGTMPVCQHSQSHAQLPLSSQQPQQQNQQHAHLLDNSNVNEIAENNNNANIERELLVDVNHQQQQHAVESPTPSTSSPAPSPNVPTA